MKRFVLPTLLPILLSVLLIPPASALHATPTPCGNWTHNPVEAAVDQILCDLKDAIRPIVERLCRSLPSVLCDIVRSLASIDVAPPSATETT